MAVRLRRWVTVPEGTRVVHLEIDVADIEAAPLDQVDRELLGHMSDDHSVADQLLALENLVRRIEEATPQGDTT